MITRIEAQNFRVLRRIDQPLGPFQVQVGPNATGKTSFQEVLRLMKSIVRDGLDKAMEDCCLGDFKDLLWNQQGEEFALAIEARIPNKLRSALLHEKKWDTLRYELRIGLDNGSPVILEEAGYLQKAGGTEPEEATLFPDWQRHLQRLMISNTKGKRKVFGKSKTGNDAYNAETTKEGGKGWVLNMKLGPRKSALGGLPEDESKFPVAIWFRKLLLEGVQTFVLDSLKMRQMSPATLDRSRILPDGSNLPWIIDNLKTKTPAAFQDWISHLQTALPDIIDIGIGEHEDTRRKYLKIKYRNGAEVPSWLVSDGTLRLLALTLPAYIPELDGVFLIEEPENGIHPRAIETVFQSLKSVYGAQVLLATHSPIILNLCEADEILCFAKKDGAADIIRGDQHPKLREWKGSPNLSVLNAAGVLG